MTAKILEFKPRADDRFGLCPKCKREPDFFNVERANFACCREHRFVWDVGWNLFGSWRHETEETWQRNIEMTSEYTVVEPFHYAKRG